MGFHVDINTTKIAFGAVVTLVLTPLIPTWKAPSALFLHLIFAAVITSTLVLMACANAAWEFGIMSILAFVVVAAIASAGVRLSLPAPLVGSSTMLPVLLALALLVVLAVAILGGYRYINFDFSTVYEMRSDAADALPRMFGYIIPIVTKAAIPFGVALAVIQKQWRYVLLLSVCSILLGAMSNHKAPMVYPLMTVGLILVALRPHAILMMLVLLSALTVAGIVDGIAKSADPQENVPWIANMGLRRSFMVPALLNFCYWEFFSNAAPIVWADSSIGLGLADNPHGIDAAKLIGAEYFGDKGTHANTGWIGSGMAQAGYLGVLIYSIGLGIVLLLVDSCARRLGTPVIVGAFSIVILTAAASSDFVGMFFTHGLATLLLLSSVVSLKLTTTHDPLKGPVVLHQDT